MHVQRIKQTNKEADACEEFSVGTFRKGEKKMRKRRDRHVSRRIHRLTIDARNKVWKIENVKTYRSETEINEKR